ncbi:MAG: hypothetical protein JRN40_00690 [Nitrososphaerota archaeon]|nr:hypothetical protein [Nitrososphaerota archaeon]
MRAPKSRMSYYAEDAAFIDWSSALVVDPSGDYAVLLVIELANLQLLDMQYYDRLLDELVEKASLDLTRRSSRRTLSGSSGTIARKVAELRIETDSVVEATKNCTNFIGEWYIARVFSSVAEKLRQRDWDASLSRRLGILEDIYSPVSEQMSHMGDIVGDNHRHPLRSRDHPKVCPMGAPALTKCARVGAGLRPGTLELSQLPSGPRS